MEHLMSTKAIASTMAQNHFGQILDDVIQNHTRYVIKRRGVPQMMMISLTDLELLLLNDDERSHLAMTVRELRPVYDLGDTVVG
jgi:PHD/YefM family antitoxin component YafN of YafNO toxin-antitoxin module